MATISRQEARKAARFPSEVVEIPDSDAGEESDESSRDGLAVVGGAATSDDDEDDDDDGEMWETESFFRDALGDSSSPVIFEPRERTLPAAVSPRGGGEVANLDVA